MEGRSNPQTDGWFAVALCFRGLHSIVTYVEPAVLKSYNL